MLWKEPKDMHVFSSGKDENRQDWESWKSILFCFVYLFILGFFADQLSLFLCLHGEYYTFGSESSFQSGMVMKYTDLAVGA